MLDDPSTAVKVTPTTAGLARLMSVVAGAAVTILWFALLAHRPLYDPDEGRYAEIPREMATGGDWVVPHLDGLVYLEKPPLQYWLTALTFRCFGLSEFTARLWTGIAGYCSLGLVFFVGYRLWGLRAGLKALLLSMASSLFVLLGHQLTLDMVLSTCLLACLTCFLMAESEAAARSGSSSRARTWMLGCWAAMALSVLSKGLIGMLIPGSTLGLYALWQRDFDVLHRLNIRFGLPLFALIAAPWFVMAARANAAFLQFFFIREHFQRFLTSIENRTEPWWYFAPVLAVGILPWLPQALRALARPFLSSAPHQCFEPARVLWVWCVFVLIFFSASNAKLIPYILPAVPALALLCAVPAASGESRRDLVLGGMLSLASCLGILIYASGAWATAGGRALATQLSPTLVGTATLLALAGLGCTGLVLRNRLDAALLVLCCGWFLASATVLVAANSVQQFFSAKDAAIALRAAAPQTSAVFSVRTYEQSFTFYWGRPVVLVDYRDEFTLGLTQDPDRGIATLVQFSDRWRSLNDAYAIMQPRTRDALLAQGLPLREIAHFPNIVLVSRR
ncbi:MAG: glycosyltransferase family 39 protein [Steroidobacteraceae bacterium]